MIIRITVILSKAFPSKLNRRLSTMGQERSLFLHMFLASLIVSRKVQVVNWRL